MFIKLLSYIPALVGVFLVGLFVLINNSKSIKNKTFFTLTSMISAWLLFLMLSDISKNEVLALWFLRFALFFGAIMYLSFVYFALVFPFNSKVTKKVVAVMSLPMLIIAFLSLTPIIVPSVSIQTFGTQPEGIGLLYTVTDLIGISYLLAGIAILLYKYRKSNLIQKNQIKFVLIGLLVAIVVNIFTGLVLTILKIETDFILFGGVSLFIFSIFVAYAIIKHKLFDIRLVVARTLGYVLSIVMLAGIYGFLAFIVVDNFIFNENSSTTLKRAVFTILAVVLATTYQPLKRFFDKWSNKIFYRDAYDSQELLDNLNKILVSTVDLNKLLKSSAIAINQSIRAEFVMFGIKQIDESPQRVLGTSEREFTKSDIEAVRSITPKLHQKSIITDTLPEEESKLGGLLRKNNIAVLMRLTDTPKSNQEGLGYIVLGNKKSGSPYSKQDIQVLEIIADELVLAIQNALRYEEIKNFSITLQDKVDDATKKLRSANKRLIELDQTKDDFISMASHQLRTPLTTIKGYISMVIEGDAGKVSKKQIELLDQAFVGSQRMVYLIADLLNVSRLRTGKFVIEPKKTNLADIVEGEITQLKETAKGRDLELTFSKPKNFPDLMLDETKIRQVIMNFADNAIYYTPSGGHIKVGLEDKGDFVEFTVTDDGIGVPKAEQHHLFNKFYRAGNAKKARPDGTGLGLFMAKKVVIAQGGSIIFKTQENRGSTFGFSFNKQPLLPENYKGVI